MISAVTYNLKGEKVESTSLPGSIFEIKVKPVLLAQAVRVWLSNQRRGMAKTKTRSEVAKTTAKMYRQKGTGRARHGSYAAPIFVGGGIAHGPSGKQNYKLSLPAKMRRLALLGALSVKAKAKEILIVEGVDKALGKTKQLAWLPAGKKLVIMEGGQTKFKRAIRNLEQTSVRGPESLSAYEVLAHKQLVLTKEVISSIKKIYAA
ncbi:MAG: 50S ribosomal protein L4 [Candidatus Amesbacteria bacterium GW2011_GWB1_47_26]|uniref:Large ribosomal subunit protein uL4 n=1 Tax=Candidatus Amesbacteria bacterium GW2011_GWC2_45_19 TaxID=1618366 RepID=A0A0G1M4A5_9BACT|nr:MAG: 50S ribosomal protein L4 [Candidatus Amesbacteria bacterium GW2011_GWC2_45_19]KKU38749.1 MAG: 50S ribosomal protein L4 [Candidatus Amesbacteria bacterium GW2011_GWA1_46_35]KKU69251.1 MAG: 50S ribosomal protein L4 [Microgenomates group bacterium GW2011_GWC1_47_20]KKU75118.1 MAG: 50S ribosomal protein L4 [Candidatus Amesbacteria bacterium GW2011_GWB1_47_26]KKU80415.1 MAG: 50S ribosomal protein L4 [Candidatus Amesbacteria bacterium GW2011_GWA2_47_70]